MTPENGTVQAPREKVDVALLRAVPMGAAGGSVGLVLRNLDEAMNLAKLLATSNIIPEALKNNPSDVLVVLLKGDDLGLKPMQALSEIHVVKGKAGCSAALKRALCLQSGLCEKFDCIDTTDKKATFETTRKGSASPVRLSWTIEQAAAAGLTGKDVWKSHPAAMLRARASSALADLVFPDVVQGMASVDELEEIQGRVTSVKMNAPPFMGTTAPDSPIELPPEPLDEVDRIAREQAPREEVKPEPKNPGELTELDKLHAMLDEAQDGNQLNKLASQVTKWPNAEEQIKLRQHFGRRGNDLRKAGK